MYFNNRLRILGQNYNMIEQMIFLEAYGTKSFNINVDERFDCMNAIFNTQLFDTTDNMLLHFCDWLAEKVFFMEIVATMEQDTHKVFMTMNDRSLSLTSTEMLKGYLFSEIKDDIKHEKLNGIWKNKVFSLKKDDDKGDESFLEF